MKFEVTDKREQREGMLSKKTVYYANARLELTDEEFEALSSMATQKEWKEYPLGELRLNDKQSMEMTVGMFFSWTKKKHGVWERGIRANTPEHRQIDIEQIMEIAKTLKAVLEARLSAMDDTDDDIAMEI